MLDRPPPSRREAERDRKRAERARRRAGEVPYRLILPRDQVVTALLVSGLLSELEALRRPLVERALARVLVEWARRWRK